MSAEEFLWDVGKDIGKETIALIKKVKEKWYGKWMC